MNIFSTCRSLKQRSAVLIHAMKCDTLNIKLGSKPGNHTLKLKVDTGAQGYTLPLRIYRRMHTKCLTTDGYPRPGGIVKHQHTILRTTEQELSSLVL